MSTFATISARRMRDMAHPLTEHERLSIATLIDVLNHDVGRCHDCLYRIAELLGDIEPGTDLTVALPVHILARINGEKS
ncbi:hypothetical protein IAG25_15835 [Caballeronia sp. EK]|uniref:hypothetical protein n=1 Tax=Caballeronia sp. EK TaxID=2767469 RepID=UPI00165630A9|nr:hypothetical protein [Caballeronia sp. EK]MBC8638291.1 hypothetical protein [Caballeronia sp. EK]